MNNNNIQSNLSPGSSPYVYNKGQNMCIQMTFTLNNEKYILREHGLFLRKNEL